VLLSLFVLLVYGGMIWGIFPSADGVSWQAHLGGAVGGVIAARALHRRAARRTRSASVV
jgi:membrane associated rhomboid family serine protease